MVDLAVSGLSHSFWHREAEIPAVKAANLRCRAGDFVGIVGKSGCGKTTLLKLIAGLEKPDAGELKLSGPAGEAPRLGVMFQDPRLLPWLTVEQNLRLAFPAKRRPQDTAELDQSLELVGLGAWKDAFPRSLSGGMAQRAALARALCRKPHLLLLDEPFSALDAFTRKQLREELEEIWKSLGMTVILVTHDIEEAVYLSGQVVHMRGGAIHAAIPIGLPRPRDCRAAAFQEHCRALEQLALGSGQG